MDARLAQPAWRSAADRRGAAAEGERAERDFVDLARARGWQVTAAPEAANVGQHWDFRIARAGRSYRVDVKAVRRISAGDAAPQDDWHWVELHGVRAEDPGWLYGSRADLIAFETRTSFLLVRRPRLAALVADRVDFRAMAERPADARYRVWRRPARHDQVTLVETAALRRIAWEEWPKPGAAGPPAER